MIRGIKGVKDILPDQIDRWLLIENSARRYARLYGFREIRLPIFEVTDLFARSIGATMSWYRVDPTTFPLVSSRTTHGSMCPARCPSSAVLM